MEAHLRLVHEEDIRFIVFDEHREEDGEDLLLATRQLIGDEGLTHLRETDLVVGAHDLLPRVGEERVHDILELLLRLREFLCLLSRRGSPLLQHGDHPVADVHLIVEIFALELVELPVELCGERHVELRHHLRIDERAVEGPDDVEAQPVGIRRTDLQMDAFEQMRRKLATGGETFHHFVEDRRLTHAVDATEDVDTTVEVP